MSRSLLVAIVLVLLSGCITLPSNVALELEPVQRDRQDHFNKP
jgi:hypothetical protein